MSDVTDSDPPQLIEKTLNIFDESTKKASERFEFNDVQGERATVELPRDESHSVKALKEAVLLANGDLSDDEQQVKEALATATNSKATRFATRVAHVGWQIGRNGKPRAFVLGSRVIEPIDAQPETFPPSWLNDKLLSIPPKIGGLERWQQKIAKPALRSSRLMLAVSCAFAAMVIRLTGFPNFG